jgi:single-stranded-DNA-specific exonuclease
MDRIETLWKMRDCDMSQAKEFACELEIPLPIAQVMLTRGIDSVQKAEQFLDLKINKLHTPFALPDAQIAIERISKAIDSGEKIFVWGDYDVDGTTSCALLFHFFKMVGVKTELFQPSRFVEGYGVHPSSIDQAIEKGIKLLITVDCGISNVETADYALEKNIDLIITDHHKDARETMPKAFAVINPNRRDETCSPEMRRLAGVGVAFALVGVAVVCLCGCSHVCCCCC